MTSRSGREKAKDLAYLCTISKDSHALGSLVVMVSLTELDSSRQGIFPARI